MHSRNIKDEQKFGQDEAGEEVEQESIQNLNSISKNTQTDGTETVKDSHVVNLEQREMKFVDDNDSVTEDSVTSLRSIRVHQTDALEPSEFGQDSSPEHYDSDDSEETHGDGVIQPMGIQPTEIGIDSTPEHCDNQVSGEKQNLSSINVSVIPQKPHMNSCYLEPRNNNSGAVIDPSAINFQPASVTINQGHAANNDNSLILIERLSQEQLAVVVSTIIRNPNDSLKTDITESLCEEINTFVKESTIEDGSENDQPITTNSHVVAFHPDSDILEFSEDEIKKDIIAYQVNTADAIDNKCAIADPVEKVSFVFFGKHIGRKQAFIAMVIFISLILGAVIFAVVFLTNKKTVYIDKEAPARDRPEKFFRNKTLITNMLKSRFSKEDLNDTNSSQSKALNWIVNETNIIPSQKGFYDLLHLASFYFAFGGDDYWQVCSRKKSCESIEGKNSWLSDEENYDYCKWPGIDECDQYGNVLLISFPFNKLTDIRGTIPNDIHHFSELKFLDLKSESTFFMYGTIPSEIGLLNNLGKKIDASRVMYCIQLSVLIHFLFHNATNLMT